MMIKNNIETINKFNPELGKRIQKSKISYAEIVKSTSGHENLLIKKSNRPRLAYQEKNPVSAIKKIIKSGVFEKDTCTIIIGMGCGHLVHRILKKMDEGHSVIVVEPELWMIKQAFSIYDFSKYLQDGVFYIATTKEDIGFLIGFVDSMRVIQEFRCITEIYTLWCEEYEEIAMFTMEMINQHKCNTGTVMGAGSVIADNDILNLPYIIRHRGVNDIKDLYKGKPAVLVNTGPSLAKNIHLLTDIQDRVIIISVAQALRILLAYDIRPDFICTVDYGEVNYEHFKGLFDSNVTLCCLNRTYAPIIKEWQGAKFICCTPTPGFEDTTSILQAKGSLEQGGSVSHMNLALAFHLGCDPIIDIGQDFAYNDGLEEDEKLLSHIEQVDAGGEVESKDGMLNWKIKDPRSSLKDKNMVMGYNTYVDGYFGKPVTTNIGLASFITAFERMVENRENRVIDGTEGGCSMKGCENITLQKCIDEIIPKESIDKSVLEPFLSLESEYDKLIDKAIDLIDKDIENLEKLIEYSEKGIEYNKKAQEYIDSETKDGLKEILDKNEEYSNKAQEYAKKNALIGVSLFRASREIHKRDLKVRGSKLTHKRNENNLKIRINRNMIILEAAEESAKRLIEHYRKTGEILKQYRDTKDESLLTTEIHEEIDLSDADTYFEAGNWAHVLVDCRRFLSENNLSEFNDDEFELVNSLHYKSLQLKKEAIEKAKDIQANSRFQDLLDFNKYIDDAYKEGRKSQEADKSREEKIADFIRCLENLRKAENLFPDREEVKWGIAVTLHHVEQYEESLRYYAELCRNYPDNLKYQFERAMVMLIVDQVEGMKQLHDLFDKTDYYDYFLKHMGLLYKDSGNIDKAIVAYEEYSKRFPGDYEVYEILESLYREIGEHKKADKIKKKYEGMR